MPAVPDFLVDFVIGGAQKSGTTALAHFLGQHPEICLPRSKEVHFFDHPGYPAAATVGELRERYRQAFPPELAGSIVGEATPIYMYLPWLPPRIRRYNPAMKWIVLLREPASRAISHYRMERARNAEWLPPALAFHAEKFRCWRDRHCTGWESSLRRHSYLDRGFYSRQIARLWESFPREQVLIITAEQLRQRHEATLLEVYRFLGVKDCTIIPPAETVFPTAGHVAVPRRTRRRLHKLYAAEIGRLEALLGRPLPEWARERDA